MLTEPEHKYGTDGSRYLYHRYKPYYHQRTNTNFFHFEMSPSAALRAFLDAREVFIKKLLELKPVDQKINVTGIEVEMVRNINQYNSGYRRLYFLRSVLLKWLAKRGWDNGPLKPSSSKSLPSSVNSATGFLPASGSKHSSTTA